MSTGKAPTCRKLTSTHDPAGQWHWLNCYAISCTTSCLSNHTWDHALFQSP